MCAYAGIDDDRHLSFFARNMHTRYGLWIILAGAIVIGVLIMMLLRMQKRKKWRKRALTRAGSNTSERSLGRTSTIGFINTFRGSFRKSKAPRGTPLDGKIEEADVEANGAGPPGAPGTPVPTALARITSNASQRTNTSVAETTEPASADESEGGGSVQSSDSEEVSDMQVAESSFRGMSKRMVGGKSKTVSRTAPKL